jgi:hypothetical protein
VSFTFTGADQVAPSSVEEVKRMSSRLPPENLESCQTAYSFPFRRSTVAFGTPSPPRIPGMPTGFSLNGKRTGSQEPPPSDELVTKNFPPFLLKDWFW